MTHAGDAESRKRTPAMGRRGAAPLPPRLFVRAAWLVHRAIYRATGGRRGLAPATDTTWGTLHLTTIGRRSGRSREAILGYFEDGPNLVTLAMNGWAAAEPAWWLNLQARPEAVVVVKGEAPRRVRARAAGGEERARLWARWDDLGDDVDAYSKRRPGGTAVVVFERIDG